MSNQSKVFKGLRYNIDEYYNSLNMHITEFGNYYSSLYNSKNRLMDDRNALYTYSIEYISNIMEKIDEVNSYLETANNGSYSILGQENITETINKLNVNKEEFTNILSFQSVGHNFISLVYDAVSNINDTYSFFNIQVFSNNRSIQIVRLIDRKMEELKNLCSLLNQNIKLKMDETFRAISFLSKTLSYMHMGKMEIDANVQKIKTNSENKLQLLKELFDATVIKVFNYKIGENEFVSGDDIVSGLDPTFVNNSYNKDTVLYLCKKILELSELINSSSFNSVTDMWTKWYEERTDEVCLIDLEEPTIDGQQNMKTLDEILERIKELLKDTVILTNTTIKDSKEKIQDIDSAFVVLEDQLHTKIRDMDIQNTKDISTVYNLLVVMALYTRLDQYIFNEKELILQKFDILYGENSSNIISQVINLEEKSFAIKQELHGIMTNIDMLKYQVDTFITTMVDDTDFIITTIEYLIETGTYNLDMCKRKMRQVSTLFSTMFTKM